MNLFRVDEPVAATLKSKTLKNKEAAQMLAAVVTIL